MWFSTNCRSSEFRCDLDTLNRSVRLDWVELESKESEPRRADGDQAARHGAAGRADGSLAPVERIGRTRDGLNLPQLGVRYWRACR